MYCSCCLQEDYGDSRVVRPEQDVVQTVPRGVAVRSSFPVVRCGRSLTTTGAATAVPAPAPAPVLATASPHVHALAPGCACPCSAATTAANTTTTKNTAPPSFLLLLLSHGPSIPNLALCKDLYGEATGCNARGPGPRIPGSFRSTPFKVQGSGLSRVGSDSCPKLCREWCLMK